MEAERAAFKSKARELKARLAATDTGARQKLATMQEQMEARVHEYEKTRAHAKELDRSLTLVTSEQVPLLLSTRASSEWPFGAPRTVRV